MNEIDLKKKEFDYTALDQQTTNFLKQKESVMGEIVGKAYTELGCQLKEAQDELSKHGYGCFEEWYVSLGFKKQSVYNYMNRYELIVQQLDKRDMIEEMPKNLVYEIAKPSADPELKQQVLDGKITTNKQYKDLEKQLKQAESEKQTALNERYHYEKLWKQEQNKPPVTVVPDEINKKIKQQELDLDRLKSSLAKTEESLKSNQSQLKEYKNDAEQHRKLKAEILDLNTHKDTLNRQIESAVSLAKLSVQIEEMLRTHLAPIRYSRALTEQRDSKAAMQNLSEVVQLVENWCGEIRALMPNNFIEIEVIK